MRGIKKALITVFLPLFLTPFVFAGDIGFRHSLGHFGTPPEPRLLYPTADTVTLAGKDSLEFSWMNDFIGIDHFIFKIYKGYNMYAAGLIYSESLLSGASSIKVKSDLFEEGQVYTWSLVQVSLSGQKSDKSFSSFKVVSK